MPADNRPLRLWILADHKPGHTSQLHGLANRIVTLANVDVRWVDATLLRATWSDWLLKRWPEATVQASPHESQPPRMREQEQQYPDIVLGAGSASHMLILLARRVFGCMAAVVMRPSIPLFLYDAAIVPRHDRPPVRDNILITRGVMNTLLPRDANVKAELHTMLIGGISKHFEWSSAHVIGQIRQVLDAQPATHWVITSSRRTPADFKPLLLAANLPRVTFYSHDETPRGWLPEQLRQSAEVWVTPDSVSMVYEAITSGAATGLFKLEPLQHGRIHEGLDEILALELYTPFERWQQTRTLPPPRQQLWEAERGARWLLEKYQAWRKAHQ